MTKQNPDPRRGRAQKARPQDSAAPSGRSRARAAGMLSYSNLEEKYIAGVPARIMAPRLVFIACLLAILAFGLLMVYSASSVEALKEEGSSTYFLFRQAAFIALGLVFVIVIAKGIPMGTEGLAGPCGKILWGIVVALLVIVYVRGMASGGAKRWMPVFGFFTLQPSELAKPVLILLAAKIFRDHYELQRTSVSEMIYALGLAVAIPLGLIILQPDFGTVAIIFATIVAMFYLAGLPGRTIMMLAAPIALVVVVLIAMEPYRIARIKAVLDPWSDPYGNGYQATLAIMAFASGGFWGRGIGNSTMKYNYLPEAHNDYILAIIGEEVGFVGLALFFAVFATMLVAGFIIAERSPRMQGKLVAYGCSIILGIQFLINSLGIIGVFPMTGKTLPFISYGGSSMIASLILAALIIRVSVESNVSSEHDERRGRLAVMDEGQPDYSSHMGRSTAGTPRRRSSSGFSVYEGGAAERPSRSVHGPSMRGERDGMGDGPSSRPPRSARGADRSSSGSAYGRINLNDNPSERLRRRDGSPRVNRDVSRRADDGRGRRGRGPGMNGRGRYDR